MVLSTIELHMNISNIEYIYLEGAYILKPCKALYMCKPLYITEKGE